MNKIFFSLLLVLSCTASLFAASQTNDNSVLTYEVRQQEYLLSTVFTLNSNEAGFLGTIEKSSLRIRTNYDLYDHAGNYECVGICRLLTLGAFYSWATEIDIYDNHNQYVGMIDGQAVTGAAAKFSLYDSLGNRVGIAYLDRTNSGFTIVDPNNEQHVLAVLKRNFVENVIDHWNVSLFDLNAIDMRIIKIFSGFAIDTQEYFQEDN